MTKYHLVSAQAVVIVLLLSDNIASLLLSRTFKSTSKHMQYIYK